MFEFGWIYLFVSVAMIILILAGTETLYLGCRNDDLNNRFLGISMLIVGVGILIGLSVHVIIS